VVGDVFKNVTRFEIAFFFIELYLRRCANMSHNNKKTTAWAVVFLKKSQKVFLWDATVSVVAAATENNDYRKDDDPGAVVVKDVA
jgi:uncharacterized membrane protein